VSSLARASKELEQAQTSDDWLEVCCQLNDSYIN